MKKTVEKRPLMDRFMWAPWALAVTYAAYGVLGWLAQRILFFRYSHQILTMSQYLVRFSFFSGLLCIAAAAALLTFYIFCIAGSRGITRTAFILGLPSALGPVMALISSKLLFGILALPSMGAGSVISAALSALVLMMPVVVMLTIFACGRRNRSTARWLSALFALLSLLSALFPVAVTVVALLMMAGNPAVAPYMTAASYVLFLRPVMAALGIAAAAFFTDTKRQAAQKLSA